MQRRGACAGTGDDVTPGACCVGAIDKRDLGLCGGEPLQNPLKIGIGNPNIGFLLWHQMRFYGLAAHDDFSCCTIDGRDCPVDRIPIAKGPWGVNDDIKPKINIS